jgi:hypothetical protein
MRKDRKEYGYEGRKENLKGAQPCGKKMVGAYGRELGMGIPSYDGEPEKAGLVPLKNKFSWMECSQDEAYKMVRGRGTSNDIEKMNDTD